MLRKPKASVLISWSVTLFFIILFAVYFSSSVAEFRSLQEINGIFLLLAAVGHVLLIASNGLLIRWLLVPYKTSISRYQAFYASVLSSIGNFFLPAGSGALLRANYLKKVANLRFKDFVTTLYGTYVILFLCYGLMGLLSLIFLQTTISNTGLILAAVFLGMIGGTGYLTLVGMPKYVQQRLKASNHKLIAGINYVVLGWKTVVRDKMLVYKIIALTLVWFALSMFVFYCSARAVGLNIKLWALVLYSALGSLTMLVNITPGSLGIRESIFLFSASVLGMTAPQILSVSIVERGTKAAVLVIGYSLEKIRKLIYEKGII